MHVGAILVRLQAMHWNSSDKEYSKVHIYLILKLFYIQWRISQWHLNSDSFLMKKMNGFSEFKIVNYVFNEKKLTTGREDGKRKPVIFVPCISNVSATCENDKLYISMCWARGTLKSIQYITRIYFYVFSHLRIFSRCNHCWTTCMMHVGTFINRNIYAWWPSFQKLWSALIFVARSDFDRYDYGKHVTSRK